MSDQEARALGAGDYLQVNGKDYKLSPVGMQQLHEIQRAAVTYYKREYLRTYSENLDLLSNGKAESLMEKKLEEVARWDVGHLPVKVAYDVRSITITDQLAERLIAAYGKMPPGEAIQKALLATMLDSGMIKPEEVESLTGTIPRCGRVPYDTWWVTAVWDGMITFIWSSVKINHSDVTKGDISKWPLQKIIEAARMTERLTSPSLGNT